MSAKPNFVSILGREDRVRRAEVYRVSSADDAAVPGADAAVADLPAVLRGAARHAQRPPRHLRRVRDGGGAVPGKDSQQQQHHQVTAFFS